MVVTAAGDSHLGGTVDQLLIFLVSPEVVLSPSEEQPPADSSLDGLSPRAHLCGIIQSPGARPPSHLSPDEVFCGGWWATPQG